MNYYDEEIEINKESSGSQNIPSASTGTLSTGSVTQLNTVISNTPKSEIKSGMKLENKTKPNGTIGLGGNRTDSSESESELSKSENPNESRLTMNSGKWNNLAVPQEIKDTFQNILKYVPQSIDAEYQLHPFIPEYVPAVGDVDAFLKVSSPESLNPIKQRSINEHIAKMGLNVLDEPNGYQSDPTTLMMKLRSTSIITTKQNSSTTKVPTAKGAKDIDKWITEVSEVHNINQSYKISNPLEMNQQLENLDVDHLMVEWDSKMEGSLNRLGLPPPEVDCDLETYCKIICNLFDIPISDDKESKYLAVHDLFNLYLAIKESFE